AIEGGRVSLGAQRERIVRIGQGKRARAGQSRSKTTRTRHSQWARYGSLHTETGIGILCEIAHHAIGRAEYPTAIGPNLHVVLCSIRKRHLPVAVVGHELFCPISCRTAKRRRPCDFPPISHFSSGQRLEAPCRVLISHQAPLVVIGEMVIVTSRRYHI